MVMKKTKARGGKMKMASRKMRGGGMGMQPKTKARAGKMKMARKMRGGGMNNKKK
jgi:hypothetical protein